jgi:hypothetical protein
MAITKSDVKAAVLEVRGEEFRTFLAARKPPKQKKIEGLRLPRDRMVAHGLAKRSFTLTLQSAAEYDEIFKGPEFLAGVGDKLQIGDTLEVRDDLLTLWALVLVVVSDQARGYTECREIFKKTLDPALVDEQTVEGFSVDWERLDRKWVVRRIQDQHVMRTGIGSRHEAMELIRTDYRPIKG